MGFFYPTNVHALIGFDVGNVVLEANKCKLCAVAPSDAGLGDFVKAKQAQAFDLVAQQLMHRVPHGGHEFTGAQDTQRAFSAKD